VGRGEAGTAEGGQKHEKRPRHSAEQGNYREAIAEQTLVQKLDAPGLIDPTEHAKSEKKRRHEQAKAQREQAKLTAKKKPLGLPLKPDRTDLGALSRTVKPLAARATAPSMGRLVRPSARSLRRR
jgi:hypothetical protein